MNIQFSNNFYITSSLKDKFKSHPQYSSLKDCFTNIELNLNEDKEIINNKSNDSSKNKDNNTDNFLKAINEHNNSAYSRSVYANIVIKNNSTSNVNTNNTIMPSRVIRAYNNTEEKRAKNISDKYSTINQQNIQILNNNPMQIMKTTQSTINPNNFKAVDKQEIMNPNIKNDLNISKSEMTRKASFSKPVNTNKFETPLKDARQISNTKPQISQNKRIGKRRKIKGQEENEVYCQKDCKYSGKDHNTRMIFCEGSCKTWYHVDCIDLSDEKLKEYDDKEWYCEICSNK